MIPKMDRNKALEFFRKVEEMGKRQPNRQTVINSYLPYLAPMESKGDEALELAKLRKEFLRVTPEDEKLFKEMASKHPRI